VKAARSIRLITMAVVAVAVALVPAVASAQSAQSPVTITMAIQAAGKSSTALQKAVDAFNAANPGITVKPSFYGTQDAYNQALQAKIAAGIAPDVFWVDAPLVSQYVKYGAVRPLDDLASQAGFPLDSFIPALVDAFKVDGKLYAIPKDFNVSVLVYNKKMLDAANVAPPKTWAELKAAAQKLTHNGVWGFGMYPQINYFYPFIASNGGQFVTQSGISNFLSSGQTEALQFFASLFKDKVAVTPQMVGASWDGDMFAKGQVAMVYGGSWLPMSVGGNLEVGVAPVPVPAAGDTPMSWSYTAGWGVSSKSQHPEAAMKFISYMESPEQLVAGFNQGFDGLPPTTNGAQALATANPAIAPDLKVYQDVAAHSVSFGWAPPSFVTAYNSMLQSLASNPSQDVSKLLSTFARDQNLK